MVTLARILLLCLCLAIPAQAAPLQTASYANWLEGLKQEALAAGISPDTVHGALDAMMLDQRVVALDQKQPEATASFADYNRRILSAERIEQGRALRSENSALLNEVSTRYGVPPQMIVALWGIESRFGHDSGSYAIVDSLATLAYEGRRAEFFRAQLLDALRILDRTHVSPEALRGSWAGAMGQCQFMPSTYLRHAVDYDGDGVSDIWKNRADVFASIANYLASEGWKPDTSWGREVDEGDHIATDEVGLDHQRSLDEWAAKGVRNLDGTALPKGDVQASLIEPDGPDGRSFLVYDNFRALMHWNRSTFFALSVGMLADRIKE